MARAASLERRRIAEVAPSVLLLALIGCDDGRDRAPETSRDASLEGGAHDAGSPDARADVPAVPSDAGTLAPGAGAGCTGIAPPCFAACGGDRLLDDPAVCIDGAWRCAQGYLPRDCPRTTCFGVPLAGEVCDDDGAWTCRPAQTGAYALCPRFACPSCEGFDGPHEEAGCRCACIPDAGVACERL